MDISVPKSPQGALLKSIEHKECGDSSGKYLVWANFDYGDESLKMMCKGTYTLHQVIILYRKSGLTVPNDLKLKARSHIASSAF